MRGLAFDLRSAARTLSRTPAFALLTIATLALGIGANTAVFSIVDAVLFRPLPLAEPERLVRIFAVDHPARYVSNSSYPVYRDYLDGTRSFSGLAAYCDSVAVHVSLAGSAPERLTAAVVTGDYFGVLGVRAQRGRLALSIAGIYGVISSSVEARRREFGIRLALGAGRRRLLGDVLGRCARIAAAGLAIGVPAALLASRSLSTILL